MMEFKNTSVFNLEGALRGMRNPLKSWEKSDSQWTDEGDYIIGPNDLDLARRLVKAGSDHRKFIRQIKVSVDITAPWYWWKEYATYKVSTVENSTSMMHTLVDDININNFEWDYMTDYRNLTLAHLKELVKEIKVLDEKIDNGRKDLIPHRKQKWRELIQDVPGSFIYTRTCTLNYETLRNMYHARKSHKLKEWKENFISWIDTLPYNEFIKE